MTPSYATLAPIRRDIGEIVRPPRRLTVTEAAEAYLYLYRPGGLSGPYKVDVTPYVREPQDLLTSRRYTALVFVGPAQSAKTQIGYNWMVHSIVADPADMLMIQTTQSKARESSRVRFERVVRHSPEIRARLSPAKGDDNVFDKYFRAGNVIRFGHPALSELSGKDVPRVWLTDRDRMKDDIGHEGPPELLAFRRTRSFMSRAMTLVESSPGRVVSDLRWSPETAHEAPPTTGILELYNQGDRRRRYWPCPHCEQFFEPRWELIQWRDLKELMAAAESARLGCPQCGTLIEPRAKASMDASGLWLRDGEHVKRLKSGRLKRTGTPRDSNIASFWLHGPAAAFQTWAEMVLEYLQARDIFERTGNMEPLKTATHQTLGLPWRPISSGGERLPEELQSRAENLPKLAVPKPVRFLTAAIDIQKNRFVVQVEGWGEGLENWVVDRFNIRKAAERVDDDGDRAYVRPEAFEEDWDLLTEAVVLKRYRLSGTTYRHMHLRMVACDIGGAKGVTENAYQYWRRLKRIGLSGRLMLVQGDGARHAPRLRRTYPDSGRHSKKSAKGEVPVWRINVNAIKDAVDAALDRDVPGPHYQHFPQWLPNWFFEELCAETRDPKTGEWTNPTQARNEAWDLKTYNRVAMIRAKGEQINWDDPPAWAAPWSENAMIVNERVPEGAQSREPAKPKTRPRVGRSRYMDR